MQICPLKGKIVERILTDKAGRLVCARFFLYERDGRFKARLIDFKYFDEEVSCEKVFLYGKTEERKYFTETFEKEYVSPFINKELLYCFGSKPRAPTL